MYEILEKKLLRVPKETQYNEKMIEKLQMVLSAFMNWLMLTLE